MNIRALCLAGAFFPALALAATPIDERRDLAPGETVTVVNVSGEIEISAWDRPEVRVTGSLGADSKLNISDSGRGLRIEVETEDSSGWGGVEDTELRLQVPADASLSASGVSADVRITGSRGESVFAESVSGDVDVRADCLRLELKSVSGDLDFAGSAARTSAEAVSGDVTLVGVDDDLEVSLVSGDLELDAGVLRRGRFESVSGTLDLRLAMADDGRVTVESMSGDVRLALPADQSGEFRAQSFSGDIRSDFGEAERAERGPGVTLEHVAGAAGASLQVESFSGDIHMKRR
ncbi:MAG: DUF4097 family beta strand repeat-containing protein [Gammaproteobacteria bacterium]